MIRPCNVWALRIWQHWIFTLKYGTPTCVWKSSISCSNEVNTQASKKRSSQVPLLKLHVSCTIMPAIDLCFLKKVSAHFVERGPHFCYLVVCVGIWKCALNRATTKMNCWFVLGTMKQSPTQNEHLKFCTIWTRWLWECPPH